ncbi:hypothetical protein ON010_g5932 [Phytophthora cinnamomi]|nr:hypothetical protein ON010_g5932 [Phytophthora cinnamomi]
MKVEGDAAFRSFPGDSFRFGVGVVDDVGELWLENQTSKKRWTCEVADVAAFAPTGVVLPQETVLHYVVASLKESAVASDQGLNLVREDGDQKLQLEVMIKLGVADFAWAPKYVFPMTLKFQNPTPAEVQASEQIKFLTTQVQELQQEVETLKEQMQAVLRAQAESQPAATPSSPASVSAALPVVKPPRRHPQSPASDVAPIQEGLPTPSRKDQVWGDIIGQRCHQLVQIDEFRESRNSDGVVVRKLRQHTCKVCSALRGERRRPFETTYYCGDCTEQHKGGMPDLARDVEQWREYPLEWEIDQNAEKTEAKSLKRK